MFVVRLVVPDTETIRSGLEEAGYGVVPRVMDKRECGALIGSYDDEALFRKKIVMQAHGYGLGEYQYFRYPLPERIETMRSEWYRRLAPIANDWNERLGISERYPATHDEYLTVCHKSGQEKPTPLLLKYKTGDFNRLHQDVYGEHLFPFQVAILLSDPESDFSGGEFLISEQRPRMQSRAEVVPLKQGDAVVFPVSYRPIEGKRGFSRAKMRHGVSRIRSGKRMTLGIILHDAA